MSPQDKVEENGHYRGQKAAEFIDKFKPTWGETTLGLQYGIALTKPQRQFRIGERVPLVVFFRNASDKPIKFDMRPDFFGNTPKVLNAKGAAIPIERLILLGTDPHYVEKLEPGEAVGPFYLNFGLGENPRPGRQHWHPFFKSPAPGTYKLTHEVSINVADQKDGEPSKRGDIATGTIAFEIVEGGKPFQGGNQPEPESTSAAGDTGNEKDGTPIKKTIQFRLLGGDQAIPLPDVEVEVTNYRGSGRERVGLFRTDEAGTAQMELPPGSYRLQLKSDKALPYLLVDRAWNKKSRGPRPSLLISCLRCRSAEMGG